MNILKVRPNAESEWTTLDVIVGPAGPAGYTPVKGVDYFDGKDGQDGYTPIKGVDYFDGLDGKDGQDGYTPIKGVDYFDGKEGPAGKDGYTPIKGVDYFDGSRGPKGEPFTYADFTAEQLEALRGPRGLTGKDGYTPVKGIDYFDGKNGLDGKDGYTPIKGVDYHDGRDGLNGLNGKDGYTPIKGVDYFDGKDGYTPVKGIDYFDGRDGLNGLNGRDGYTPIKGVDYFTAAEKQEIIDAAVDAVGAEDLDLSRYATTEYVQTSINASLPDLSPYAKRSELPSTAGLASERYVDNAIAAIELPEVDLDDYYTKVETDAKFNIVSNNLYNTASKDYVAAEIAKAQLAGKEVDLSIYALKTDIPDTSNLASTGYVDEKVAQIDVTGYATNEYVDNAVEGLVDEEFVKQEIAKAQLEGEDVDLSIYALKSDIPDVSDYASREYVDTQINGIELIEGPRGPIGPEGKSITHSWSGYNLILTSASGTTTTNLRGSQGERGLQGPKGNPFTYEDFTEEQLAALKGADGTVAFDELTEEQRLSLKGDKGDSGYTPIKGVDYFDGEAGYTPVRGVDYYTNADKQELIAAVVASLPVAEEEAY